MSIRQRKPKCPYRAEMVKVEAKVCKHCGNDIEPYVAEVDPNALTPVQQTIGGFAVLGIIFYAITN